MLLKLKVASKRLLLNLFALKFSLFDVTKVKLGLLVYKFNPSGLRLPPLKAGEEYDLMNLYLYCPPVLGGRAKRRGLICIIRNIFNIPSIDFSLCSK